MVRLVTPGSGGGAYVAPAPNGVFSVGAISTIIDDTKYNAWPDVVRLQSGDLFLAYVKGDSHNEDNTGRVVTRTSSNDGASWSGETVVASNFIGCINVGVCQLASGRIVLMYNVFNAFATPRTPPDAVRVIYSDDDGGTWSSPYTVDSAFTDQCASATTSPVQLPNGDVLIAVYGIDSGDTYWSASLLRSTDDGETFGDEVIMADGEADGRNYYEPSLCVVSASRLLVELRSDDGEAQHRQKVSTDGGATWGSLTSTVLGLGAPKTIRLSTGTLILVTRQKTTLACVAFTSLDGGVTWGAAQVLDDTMYEQEYGCPVELVDGRALVVYGYQVTSSTTNADIKQVYLTEGRS